MEKRIEKLLDNYGGTIGVYVKNLHNNKTVSIKADSIFPTASMVKIPIMIGVMDKINKGELSYHQELVYDDSLLYAGVDILGSFKQGEKIELSKVMMLMLTMSDNTASLWLQSLAGTGTRINQLIDSLGFPDTKVNSRTPGREDWRSVYGWGQTSPREMAGLMERIYKREIISEAASDRMLRSLNKNYWDAEALSQIPPYAAVFSKNGAVDESRSEVVLVKGKRSAYVFCICTKNNKDTSWNESNEAWQVIRKISALLWNYFEPKDNWVPEAEAARFH
ncbi:MAG TPA: serine hydrolase [Flavisolibacter sp.]|nr:serine hydrolase [Flavisolibacter sp.]